jgi:hypothetical protein
MADSMPWVRKKPPM